MAVELLGNLGESTLSAAISSTSATTLTVTSATPFPAAVTGTSQFRVIIDSEIMIVTNVSGTTFTVTRGAEGTTAATHASGAPITHVVTAAVLAAIGVPAGAGGAGKVLTSGTADYAQAWTTNKAGGGDYFKSGNYSLGMFGSAAISGASPTTNTMMCRPFIVPVRRAFDRIGINITTAATAASGGVVRLGIYADGGGAPGALILDAGTVSTETTGAKEITIAQTLDAGIYYVVAVVQVATCQISQANTAPSWSPFQALGTAPPSSLTGTALTKINVTGALPDPAAATNPASTTPMVVLRAT